MPPFNISTYVKKKFDSHKVDIYPTKNGFCWIIPRKTNVEYGIMEEPSVARKMFNTFCRRKKVKPKKIYSYDLKELTPSELIHELGKRMDSEDSVIYWAAKNNISIFCPGITDGAFGMQLYFFQQSHSDFKIDVVKDLKKIVELTVAAEKTGAIILGGGIAKHHTIIANLMRDGFDYAVYIISSSPYRGSLSSATTQEAKSWGKIRQGAKAVTIQGDAAILFPLMIASLDFDHTH